MTTKDYDRYDEAMFQRSSAEIELAEKLMEFLEEGNTKYEAAEKFSISIIEIDDFMGKLEIYDPLKAAKIRNRPLMVLYRLINNQGMTFLDAVRSLEVPLREFNDYVRVSEFVRLFKNQPSISRRLYIIMRSFLYQRGYRK